MSDSNYRMDMVHNGISFGQRPSTLPRSDVSTSVDAGTGKATVEAQIACPPRRVFELLTDYPNLPLHIAGLHEVEVLTQFEQTASIRYTMKLPFPLGSVQWTNLVSTKRFDNGAYLMEWLLIDGDLSECKGRITLEPVGEFRDETRAIYQIHVEHKNRVPKRAQQLVVRWLLPRVINRLCRTLASGNHE